ncbi:spore germination protein [Halobacillus sp. B23F22_1]|uniref:spore germination protein n=1 Tax=Halobacillus sp. B23F22_1 TaxID=3459514 RepID=UPI00373F720D
MDTILSFFSRTDVYMGALTILVVPLIFSICFHKLTELRKNVNRPRKRSTTCEEKKQVMISSELSCNLEHINTSIGNNSDVTIRRFKLGFEGRDSALIHIDGLVDKQSLQESIFLPLMKPVSSKHSFEKLKKANVKDYLFNHVIGITDVKEADDFQTSLKELLSGSALLIIDGLNTAIVLGVKGWKTRAIEEPVTEGLVRGPRLGFIENLRDNTSILRRLTNDPNLTMLDFEVGERTKRKLVVVYLKDVANESLVEEVKERINNIDLDDAPESGYIEQLIEDNYLSLFPQVQSTERPDRVMGGLLEGRVSILLDGTPFALILPTTFSMMLQSPEDYYERWLSMSLIRMLRYGAAMISIFLPSFYIAFVSFHQGLIPTELALAIASTRDGVPFPTIIEALIMEVAIEMLREAGLRLPSPVGQTVGLVGALIIGEAAVQAGLVSPIMVIVVATTAIASFVSPQYGAGIALRMLRFLAMFSAAVLGLYGIILFFLALCIHVVKLRSFGVPYVTPGTLYSVNDLKDFIFRLPLFTMKQRPKELFPKDLMRRRNR